MTGPVLAARDSCFGFPAGGSGSPQLGSPRREGEVTPAFLTAIVAIRESSEGDRALRSRRLPWRERGSRSTRDGCRAVRSGQALGDLLNPQRRSDHDLMNLPLARSDAGR